MLLNIKVHHNLEGYYSKVPQHCSLHFQYRENKTSKTTLVTVIKSASIQEYPTAQNYLQVQDATEKEKQKTILLHCARPELYFDPAAHARPLVSSLDTILSESFQFCKMINKCIVSFIYTFATSCG